MSARVDKFCARFRDQLNALEARLAAVNADIRSIPGQGEKGLREKLEAARTGLHAQKERIEHARIGLKTWAQQTVAETREAVGEWKTKRQAHRLKAHADRAEVYAADALALALASIDEAEVAILDAVVARMDADATP